MSKRNFFKKLGALALSASLAIACVGCGNSAISTATGVESSESKATSGDTIKVGILHSMSGTMAMSEMPMVDATKWPLMR